MSKITEYPQKSFLVQNGVQIKQLCLKLYRSLITSKLDYGCIVYGSASKTALVKLNPVHNQGLRLSLGAFRSSPVESFMLKLMNLH